MLCPLRDPNFKRREKLSLSQEEMPNLYMYNVNRNKKTLTGYINFYSASALLAMQSAVLAMIDSV